MASDRERPPPEATDYPAYGDLSQVVDARLDALLGAASGPVNWHTVESGDAGERWAELREWVGWFRTEFGYDHRVVPPCWYRHAALVSVLSALRDHWICAYDPLNTPVGASDWHRTLQQLESRLRDWASRTGCTAGMHRPDLFADYPDDADDWNQHITDDIAARAAREQRETRSAIGVAQRTFGITETQITDEQGRSEP